MLSGEVFRNTGRAVLFGLAYFLCAYSCRFLSPPDLPFVSFWLPSGLFLAVLLRNEYRAWPALVAAAALANITFDLVNDKKLATTTLFTLGNSLEAIVGATLVRRFCRTPHPDLTSLREMVAVSLFAAGLSTMLSATIGTATLFFLMGARPAPDIWSHWWAGDACGILVFAPLLLNWPDRHTLARFMQQPRRLLHATILLATLGLLLVFLFTTQHLTNLNYQFLLIPITVWAAVSFGIRTTSIIVFLFAVTGAGLYSHLPGHPVGTSIPTIEELKIFQFFCATASITGMVLAITLHERRRATLATAEAEKYFRATLDGMPLIAVNLDQTGAVKFANRFLLQLTGWSLPEIVGRNWFDLFVDSRALRDMFQQAIDENRLPEEYENEIKHRDGTRRLIKWKNTILLDDQNRPRGATGIGEDITDKRAEEQRRHEFERRHEQSQRLESLGVLAGGVAHDFNNLVAGICNYIEIARGTCTDRERQESLAEAIRIAAQTRGLTRQLLTFAKGGNPVRKVDSLTPAIKETIAMVFCGTSTALNIDIPGNLWPVEFDNDLLRQALVNILTNARQAMPVNGVLCVSATNTQTVPDRLRLATGRYVRLSISDNGGGIPADALPRIFDPFFTTKQEGTGLGLPSAYSIVAKHDGGIDVETSLGYGSVFHIYLPAASTPIPAAPATEPARSQVATGSTVIIMDDEETLRRSMGILVRRMGYTATAVADGAAAVAALTDALAAGKPVVAIMLDLTVRGGMGGEATAAAIQALAPTIPIIAISGYAESPAISEPGQYGFRTSLQKPFTARQLEDAIRSVT